MSKLATHTDTRTTRNVRLSRADDKVFADALCVYIFLLAATSLGCDTTIDTYAYCVRNTIAQQLLIHFPFSAHSFDRIHSFEAMMERDSVTLQRFIH